MRDAILIAGIGFTLFLFFGVYVASRAPEQLRSYLGCGVALLGHRFIGEGSWEAIRCITILYLPVWPLNVLVLEPRGAQFTYGGNYTVDSHSFLTIGSRPPRLQEIGRLLFFAWILVPLVAFGPAFLVFTRLPAGPQSVGAAVLRVAAVAWSTIVLIYLHERVNRIYAGRRARG